jgi:hypothetical protein
MPHPATAAPLSTSATLHPVSAVTAAPRTGPPPHVSLYDPGTVARLLGSLRVAGARDQATTLTDPLPTADMFKLFLKQQGRTARRGRAASVGLAQSRRETADAPAAQAPASASPPAE